MSTILITGATSGLGRYIAFELVRSGHVVLAHGRDPGRTRELVAELRAEGDAEPFVADLASLTQVRELGAQVAEAHPDLDVLINNAGVGAGAPGTGRELSTDGHELRFAVNYLAPVVLTRALLPVLRANTPARIVNVGSVGQEPLAFDDVEFRRGYDGFAAYCRAKFALAAHTFTLAEELADTGVSVNVLHPATFMDTAMVREGGVTPWNTVADGAPGVLALATQDRGTGGYFDGTSRSRAHESTYDHEVQKRLSTVTEQLLAL
ncbi:SDR family NAD(P)-dependent oxidoreductase [Streptomyces sp. NBC_00201]|uniref:SDR family NAD(P)-dependent oxidoreductase n=1 Tax=unclassified Streptomyces TaxID=2593676 RepID=UPI00224F1214|nr:MULTISPECIES: SDR family NAD(P)-dependent oxidoreductase [unclassified Streptomyces]MCX5062812.1 SDR family NAD(P)-dependent oxidoreductase [Streptomyces sp. NBC_00452]MCX5250491.1 SDR family NAD(P)-dependent oxidoreductase [Streptomyces sp. NBC_00201]MCX5291582.1 SDR family NAD(P)-dependent oxidoreductase [Streptomyces sp. NBC_00183]